MNGGDLIVIAVYYFGMLVIGYAVILDFLGD